MQQVTIILRRIGGLKISLHTTVFGENVLRRIGGLKIEYLKDVFVDDVLRRIGGLGKLTNPHPKNLIKTCSI